MDNHPLGQRIALFFALAALSSQAVTSYASGPKDSRSFMLEEVVITATKRGETSLQDTAVSVSAVTGKNLEDSGVRHVEDLQAYIPNLVVGDSADTPGDAVVTIRGIGTQILSIGADPSSSVHTDGVYNSRPGTVFSEFLDVERVEVLRGPQGTLYGRNSVGGTINIIHKKPTFDNAARLTAEVGNLNAFRGVLTANGTLVEDRLAGRLAISRRERDGWIKNAVDGKDYGAEAATALRAALLWEVSDNATLLVKTDWADKDTDNRPAKLLQTGLDPDDGALSAQLLEQNGALPTADDWYRVNQNTTLGVPFRDQDDFGISAELTIDLGNFTLTSLTGYRVHEAEYLNDTDLTSLDLVNDFLETESNQFSEELRIASNFSGKVNFQASLFYMKDDAELDIYSDLNAGNHPLAAAFFLGFDPADTTEILVPILQENTTEAMAVFGEVYIDFTDKLRLTLGGRYSSEEKDFEDATQASILTETGTVSFFPGQGGLVQFPGKGAEGLIPVNRNQVSDDWSDFTPKIVLEYSASKDLLYYLTYAEGFKSGGFDARVAVPGNSTPAFEPESVDNLELGVKATLMDGRARVNMALFRMEYTDQQITSVDNQSGLPVVTTSNAGESRFQGFEFEGEILLAESLKLGAGLAYLDAEYITFSSLLDGDVSGLTPRDAPEWSFNTFIDYNVNLDSGDLLLHVDGSWRDDNVQRASVNSDNQHIIDAYSVWNTRMTYTHANGNWSVSLWGRNSFDKEYEVSKVDQPFGRNQVYLGMTRTYGLTLNFNF